MTEFEHLLITTDETVKDVETVGDKIDTLIPSGSNVNLIRILVGGHFPGKLLEEHLIDLGHNVTSFEPQTSKYRKNKSGNEVEWVKDLTPWEKILLVTSAANGAYTLLFDELVQDGDTLDIVTEYISSQSSLWNKVKNVTSFVYNYINPFRERRPELEGNTRIEKLESLTRVLFDYFAADTKLVNGNFLRGVLHIKPDYAENGHTPDELDFYAKVLPTPEGGKKLWVDYEWNPETHFHKLSTRKTIKNNKIALLDFGAQYLQLISRVLTEQGAQVDMFPYDVDPELLEDYSGIVLSGGPKSIRLENAPRAHPDILELGVPILAICYGLQWANDEAGGVVNRLNTKEYGEIEIQVDQNTGLFKGLEAQVQRVLMSHGDSLEELAPGFQQIAHVQHAITGESIPAYIYNSDIEFHGVQFHPEVEITQYGPHMLRNFIDICGIEVAPLQDGETHRDYHAEITQVVEEIQEQVGSRKVIIGMSGGVDSTVARALLAKALPEDQIISVHFETGLNRKGESEHVVHALNELGYNVEYKNISEHIFESRANARYDLTNGDTPISKGTMGPILADCIHPQLKRWSFTEGYVEAFLEVMKEHGLSPKDTIIAQGTLHTDLVESGATGKSGVTDVIKSHHNVGGSLDHYDKVNPNYMWHKDEAREVGRILGVPEQFIQRQPFPGPGLSVRIICSDGENVYRMSEQDHLLYQGLEKQANSIASEYGFSAVLTPIRTVGVAGDERDFSYLAVLLPNKPWEDMTAKDWQLAKAAANAIPMYAYETVDGQEEGISRVLLSYRQELHGTQNQLTPTYVTPDVVSSLQEGVYAVEQLATNMELDEKIAQFPISLLPLAFGEENGRALSLRPFVTKDWMTGRPAVPGDEYLPLEFIENVLPTLKDLDYSNILFDLSSKPKGTTELE